MTALEALKAKFPGKKIESIEFYKRDNTLYVDNKALAQLFDVTARTVENWKKNLGLEHTKLSPPKVQIYPFFDVLNWHFENVKTANASLGKGSMPIKYPLQNNLRLKQKILTILASKRLGDVKRY